MSEENKDLGDMADDAMDSAKEGAENLSDKAGDALDSAKEKASELGDKAEETFEDAKEAASDFADDVKKEANEFKNDVKETFSADNPERGKTVAIIAHLTLIGWVIALIMNNGDKTEIGSFYIRQVLGIMLLGFVLGLIPIVNLVAWIVPFVLWIISLIGAFGGKEKKVMLVGDYFQDWFKAL